MCLNGKELEELASNPLHSSVCLSEFSIVLQKCGILGLLTPSDLPHW